jgi:hypothetical protein
METESERWDGDERKEENAHLRLSIYRLAVGGGGGEGLMGDTKESKRSKGRKARTKKIRK